ncbi:MAG: hypothetical protein Q9219_007135 [cf. Caloplaca sp. 3 TL-2023]
MHLSREAINPFGGLTQTTDDVEDRRLAAQVHLTTKLPTLALEEIDHHLEYVTCSRTSILLGFSSTSIKHAVIEELRAKDNFYLLTAHHTCNYDGERNVYLVSAVSAGNAETQEITLSVSPARWKGSIQDIRIDLAKSTENYVFPDQGKFRKRQAPSTPDATVAVSTATGAASTVQVSFPAPPSSTPTETNTHQDIGFSWIDTPLLPPSFPGVDSITLHAPAVPQGVTVSCKNCTVTGTIDILQASISGNSTDSESSEDDDDFTWDMGSFIFEANDFSAHIELGATVQASADLATFNAPLPVIGLPGFSIPGIGAVGPIFKPQIVLGTQVGSQLEFGYGFNLTVPNNSTIILDLGDPTNSSINGFPDSEITPLPFTASVENVALTVSASFRPELLLGVSILTSLTSLGAGVFFNLPTVSATVAQVAHVNSRCEPVPSPSSSANASANSVDDVAGDVLFDGLTHIESGVEFDVGVLAQGQVGVVGVEEVFTVFNTSFAGPTACLSFDRQGGTLGAVAAATMEGKGKGAAVPSGSSSGAVAAGRGRMVGKWKILGLLSFGRAWGFVVVL